MSSTDSMRRKTWAICLGAEGVAASTAYVLVDLSDTTNFPHTETSWINVLGALVSAEAKTDGQYDIWLGVVTENDGSDGTAKWFDVIHLEAVNNPTDSTGHFDIPPRDYTFGGANPDGINCKVTATGATPYIGSNQTQAANGNWQNDVGLASIAGAAAGATGKPAAGDVVMWVEKVAGGTVDFNVTLVYEDH